MSLGSDGFNRVHALRKIRRDFAAQTFALIAQVSAILHRVSWSNKMAPNAPKHYEMQQNISLGSNGVDWVRSLRKLPTRLCGTNFFRTNCTSSARFAPSFTAVIKESQMHLNTMKRAKT